MSIKKLIPQSCPTEKIPSDYHKVLKVSNFINTNTDWCRNAPCRHNMFFRLFTGTCCETIVYDTLEQWGRGKNNWSYLPLLETMELLGAC